MRTVKFKAGDTILKEGEQGDTAFLIVDGSVEITVGEGAKAKNVGVLASPARSSGR
jgi:CRP/FNR family cyclic AMP-dependent transcriptional regulator